MDYMSVQDASEKWGISKRRVQYLCANYRIPGVKNIGNVWAIPSNSEKPNDARRSKSLVEMTDSSADNNISVRRKLKSVIDFSFNKLNGLKYSPIESLRIIITIFSSEQLNLILNDPNKSIILCEKHYNYFYESHKFNQISEVIKAFLIDNNIICCLDDCLSWVYQYGAVHCTEIKFRNTQFFTEKYMISSMTDPLDLYNKHKILDPACGGGNFLLYCIDALAAKIHPGKNTENEVLDILNKIYGYEIDSFLAAIASFNIKIKIMSILKSNNILVDNRTFEKIHPNIFFPQNETMIGFLDIDNKNQNVINCTTKSITTLYNVINGSDIVLTNPPFQTVKGMSNMLKEYLQLNYQSTKCDMCNSFFLRIMDVIEEGGTAAMVLQTSWMYLDSFAEFRKKILENYCIRRMVELGSNAFLDISGEKANVVLVTISKSKPTNNHQINFCRLTNMNFSEMEKAVRRSNNKSIPLLQSETLNNNGYRFDIISTQHLRALQTEMTKYREFAVPMQGTSTGNSGELVDFFWRHINDDDWILVSKGGGYSRYEGLNLYSVKWGKSGEFIKETKGSVIRNANYFSQTQLVFSDTGTAGLNVRLLLSGQIFIASGPGIRVTSGMPLAHLAFLNSRYASFFVKLLSPKLTISAGYIGQIPVKRSILFSKQMEELAKKCLRSKINRLKKRPENYEFSYFCHNKELSIFEASYNWFIEDIDDEWNQLQNEQQIENIIIKEMQLSQSDLYAIDDFIGEKNVYSADEEDVKEIVLEKDLCDYINYSCHPRRTKSSKKSLGTDGIIEFISQMKHTSCQQVYTLVRNHYSLLEQNYINLYLHALTISALKYRDVSSKAFVRIEHVIKSSGVTQKADVEYFKSWISDNYNLIHDNIFCHKPIFYYNSSRQGFEPVKEDFV